MKLIELDKIKRKKTEDYQRKIERVQNYCSRKLKTQKLLRLISCMKKIKED